MPSPTFFQTTCPACSSTIKINSRVIGEMACSHCNEQLEITQAGDKVEIRRTKEFKPTADLSDEVIEKLKPVEWQSLQEAALCSGSGSYVASEFMATRALESLSKRLTKERTWADAIGELEDEYEELTGAIEYLKNERNQVAHPDKEESSRIEARQTYDMVIRMVEEILNPDEKYKN